MCIRRNMYMIKYNIYCININNICVYLNLYSIFSRCYRSRFGSPIIYTFEYATIDDTICLKINPNFTGIYKLYCHIFLNILYHLFVNSIYKNYYFKN